MRESSEVLLTWEIPGFAYALVPKRTLSVKEMAVVMEAELILVVQVRIFLEKREMTRQLARP